MQKKKAAHRPVDKLKQQAILDSARSEFVARGYASASIERIAENAGVSKVTIYNQFRGKQELLTAVVESQCNAMRSMLPDVSRSESSIHDTLMGFSRSIMIFMSSPDNIRFERRIAAEADQYPEMGERFLNAGPRPIKAMLAEMIADEMRRGRLVRADAQEAAGHLFGIIRGFADLEWRFSNPDNAAFSLDEAGLEAAIERYMLAYRP